MVRATDLYGGSSPPPTAKIKVMNLQNIPSLEYPDSSNILTLTNTASNQLTSSWITTTGTQLNNLVQNQIHLCNPLPPTAVPLERDIFPYRTKIVYKDSVILNKYYLQNIKDGELCKTDYSEISFEDRGVIPEQLIAILLNRLSNDNKSKEYTEAVKYLKVAQAYLEKYSLENVKK